jgi:hypothetical protein
MVACTGLVSAALTPAESDELRVIMRSSPSRRTSQGQLGAILAGSSNDVEYCGSDIHSGLQRHYTHR